jgi:hypothetical protein
VSGRINTSRTRRRAFVLVTCESNFVSMSEEQFQKIQKFFVQFFPHQHSPDADCRKYYKPLYMQRFSLPLETRHMDDFFLVFLMCTRSNFHRHQMRKRCKEQVSKLIYHAQVQCESFRSSEIESHHLSCRCAAGYNGKVSSSR